MTIHFQQVTDVHISTILNWLSEPYVMEFWDNSDEHKNDILNFVNGRIVPSPYCDGKFVYWIASFDDQPFAMLMTIQETGEDDIGIEKISRLSKTGNSYGLDYMIGNRDFIGKGYGAKTLIDFLDFFRRDCDLKADTFLIDPASDNPRAKHIYEKAGFDHVCDFVMPGEVSGKGKVHHLLIRQFVI